MHERLKRCLELLVDVRCELPGGLLLVAFGLTMRVSEAAGLHHYSWIGVAPNEWQNCYAEINQVFPPRKKFVPLAASFVTRLSDGWQFSNAAASIANF